MSQGTGTCAATCCHRATCMSQRGVRTTQRVTRSPLLMPHLPHLPPQHLQALAALCPGRQPRPVSPRDLVSSRSLPARPQSRVKTGRAGAGGCRLTGLTLMSQTFPKDGMSRGIPHRMNPPVPPDESPHRDWLGQVCQILGKVLTRGDALLRPYSGGVHRLTGVCTGLFLCTPLNPPQGPRGVHRFVIFS